MVVNDRPNPPVDRPAPAAGKKQKQEKKPHRLSVIGVQCLSCVLLILLALLLRFAGGSSYEKLRQTFQEQMMRNDLLATLAALWDGDPLEGAVSDDQAAPQGDENADNGTTSGDVPQEDVPEGEATAASQTALAVPQGAVAVALKVTVPACPPVAQGTVTSGYGYRVDPTGGGQEFHRGVDVAAPEGTAIRAMYHGTITAVGESDSLGLYVRLDHGDGVEVLYAHCSRVLAAEGAVVRAGERVALVGSTGDSTGSHVHVQVTCDGVVYDPSAMMAVARYA